MKIRLFSGLTVFVLFFLLTGSAVAGDNGKKKTNPSEIGETYIGAAVAEAMKDAMKTEIALISGGSLGYKNLPEKINDKTIPRIVPFGTDLVVAVKLKGADLKSVLEKSMSLLPRRSTSFLQAAGISLVCDLNKEPGARITSVKINGKPLAAKTEYSLATTDFLSSGGGGLTSFRKGKVIENIKGMPLDEVILKHIKYNKKKIDDLPGNIIIIPVKKEE